jgi:membrane associated rhomboid family serine protease
VPTPERPAGKRAPARKRKAARTDQARPKRGGARDSGVEAQPTLKDALADAEDPPPATLAAETAAAEPEAEVASIEGTAAVAPEPRPLLERPAAGPLDRDAAVALIEGADVLVNQGEFEQAAIIYTRVIGHRDADLHVAALLGLAECRFRLDEEEAALQAWIVATQAPETPLTWLAWKRLASARVREGNLPSAARAYREAEKRAPMSERAEIASRLGWLTKELGDERAARGYFARARAGGVGLPVATYVILAVTIGIGISTYLTPGGGVLIGLLGLDKAAVAAGELYRLVSVVLVHSPVVPLHLAGNMYALYLVGPIVESLYGRVLFVGIYLLTAAAASTASYVVFPEDSVGASGAIFGLFGVLFVALRIYRPVLGRQARSLGGQIGVLIALNLFLGLAVGSGVIDNAAHIGGLLAGGWIGLLIRPRGAPTQPAPWQVADGQEGGIPARDILVAALGIALLLAMIAIGLTLGPAR